jgi:hypothetical protein
MERSQALGCFPALLSTRHAFSCIASCPDLVPSWQASASVIALPLVHLPVVLLQARASRQPKATPRCVTRACCGGLVIAVAPSPQSHAASCQLLHHTAQLMTLHCSLCPTPLLHWQSTLQRPMLRIKRWSQTCCYAAAAAVAAAKQTRQ